MKASQVKTVNRKTDYSWAPGQGKGGLCCVYSKAARFLSPKMDEAVPYPMMIMTSTWCPWDIEPWNGEGVTEKEQRVTSA